MRYVFTAVAVVTLLCIGFVFLAVQDTEYRKTAPCEEFAEWSIRVVPSRCLDFFISGLTKETK